MCQSKGRIDHAIRVAIYLIQSPMQLNYLPPKDGITGYSRIMIIFLFWMRLIAWLYVTRMFSDNRACLERGDRILASRDVSWESGGPQVDAADPGSRSSSSASDTGGRCGRRDSLDRLGVRCLLGRDCLRKRSHLLPVVS